MKPASAKDKLKAKLDSKKLIASSDTGSSVDLLATVRKDTCEAMDKYSTDNNIVTDKTIDKTHIIYDTAFAPVACTLCDNAMNKTVDMTKNKTVDKTKGSSGEDMDKTVGILTYGARGPAGGLPRKDCFTNRFLWATGRLNKRPRSSGKPGGGGGDGDGGDDDQDGDDPDDDDEPEDGLPMVPYVPRRASRGLVFIHGAHHIRNELYGNVIRLGPYGGEARQSLVFTLAPRFGPVAIRRMRF